MREKTNRCKVHCKKCGAFVGFIQADGSQPFSDDCVGGLDNDKCPLLPQLVANQPRRRRPLGLGGHGGPLDSDAGSYQSIARRALEDAGHDLEEAGLPNS